MSENKIHVLQTPPAADTSADVRRALADSVDFITQLHGGHLAGFTLVAWDTFGNGAPVAFHGRMSPISDDMLPTYAMSLLQQQAVLLKLEALKEGENQPKE